MIKTKPYLTMVLLVAAMGLNGCAVAYVGGKAVGAAVDVTTTAVSLTAHGAGAVVGLATGGGDECEAEDESDADEEAARCTEEAQD